MGLTVDKIKELSDKIENYIRTYRGIKPVCISNSDIRVEFGHPHESLTNEDGYNYGYLEYNRSTKDAEVYLSGINEESNMTSIKISISGDEAKLRQLDHQGEVIASSDYNDPELNGIRLDIESKVIELYNDKINGNLSSIPC